MTKIVEVTMDTAAGGVAPEQFAFAMQRVLENIRDPNYDPTAVRQIAMIFTCKPRPRREGMPNEMDIKVRAKVKLADLKEQAGFAFIEKTPAGLKATTNDVRQEELEFRQAEKEQGVVGHVGSEAAGE